MCSCLCAIPASTLPHETVTKQGTPKYKKVGVEVTKWAVVGVEANKWAVVGVSCTQTHNGVSAINLNRVSRDFSESCCCSFCLFSECMAKTIHLKSELVNHNNLSTEIAN